MPSTIFGSLKLPSATDVFTINSGSGIDSNQLLAKAMKREVDRLQGYKVNITVAEAKKLESLRAEITRLEERAGPDGLSADQYEDRAELYREANEILGKPYVDVSANPDLKKLVDLVDTLLEPQHRGAKKKRLENLRSLELKLFDSFERGNTSKGLARQIANVQQQIRSLVPPRKMSELSASERRQYDVLVEEINRLVGHEYLMPSRKRARAEQIQQAMKNL